MKLALSVITCLFAASSLYGQEAAPDETISPAQPAVEQPAPATEQQDAAPAPVEPQLTEQEVIKEMTGQLSKLVSILSKVRDEATASASANEVATMMEKLFSVDYAAYEGLDEEEVAAGLTDLFNDLELQVSRLYESDFYGNSTLKKTFGAEEEPFTPPPGKDDDEPGDENEPDEEEDEPLNEPD